MRDDPAVGTVRARHPQTSVVVARPMAGGHDGRTAVAQVSDQESDLTPYRRSVFEARSSRITVSRQRDRKEVGNNCSMVTVAGDKLRTHSNGAGAMRRSALYAGLFVLFGMTGC